MDPLRWKQIDALVDAAFEVSDEMRVNFVKVHAGEDLELCDQVLKLLRASSEAENFLNDSALQVAGRAIADDTTVEAAFAFIGKNIGRYKVEKILGVGGMGEVYLAQDQQLKRNVALKILPAEFLTNDDRVKRFELEARAVSSLNHPGIVTVYDVGNFEGINFIATEFVEGKTIRDLMAGKYKLRDILSNSIQICEALSAAHQAGIIHRDIKPENIMIRSDGYAKVLDFGLAKLTDPGSHTLRDLTATSKGVIIGTPAYMSPAQISDDDIDYRTDLWSCGVVLYEFLAGKNPFKGASRQETFEAILSRTPPPCSKLNPEVPEELDRILSKLLKKDPTLGYQSAADLRTDLKRVKREVDSSPSWSGSGTRENAYSNSRGWSFYAAGVLATLLTGFAIYYLFFSEPLSAVSEWATANSVQLTFRSGIEAYPTLSPDGRSILYVTDLGNGDDIFLLRIGGTNAINLTEDSPARDTMPAFSPDGNLIAFRSDREPAGIFVMGATGENPRRIADFGFSPSWSSDGKEIVVATGHQPVPSVKTKSALWIIDVATGEKRMLIDSHALQPAWSPRGNRIAYWTTGDSGDRAVETISVNGGVPVAFANEGNTNWNPVWSPDGKYLYFASDRRGNMAIWRSKIDLVTGQPIGEVELVPTPARFNRHMAFSADGRRMAYVQTSNRSNIRLADFDEKTEKTTGPVIAVTSGDFDLTNVDLSPDGQIFYARLIRKTQDDIVSLRADGTDLRDLTNDVHFDRYPRLSPDGTRILFVSDRSGTYQIWMMNSDGTNLRQISPAEAGATSMPVWAPDGKRFSFDNEGTGFIADIDSPIDLANIYHLPKTENGGWFRTWSWSPDGRFLAGNFDSAHGPGSGIYSLETRSYIRLIDQPAIPKWFTDSRRLIFLSDRRPKVVDIETGNVRDILVDVPGEMSSIAISRDGGKVFYTTFDNESDIWLLDIAPK